MDISPEPYDRRVPRGSYDRSGKINRVVDVMSAKGRKVRTSALMEATGLTRTNLQAILTSLVNGDYATREFMTDPGSKPVYYYGLTATGHSQAVKIHDKRDWNVMTERQRLATEQRRALAKKLGRSVSNQIYEENQAAKEAKTTRFAMRCCKFIQLTVNRGATTRQRKERREWWDRQPL